LSAPNDTARVRVCKSHTVGLTPGRTYVVRDVDGMVETLDDRGNVNRFWSWRFDPGPPEPRRGEIRAW
jgi:hypothetical protein